MIRTRLLWAAWAIAPVGVLAYHFGPGQQIAQQDLAASLYEAARALEHRALELQALAHEKHVAALAARRALFIEDSPEHQAASAVAGDAERGAFQASSEAWKQAADAFGRILASASGAPADTVRRVRWSRSRALVRAGDIWAGIDELESVLEELENEGRANGDLARATREELGAAHYYGARLMRLGGEPETEWMVDSGKARQHFRYLAERARADGLPAGTALNYERNVEQVLDLEQSAKWELEGKPLPKDSPLGRTGNRPGKGKGKRKDPPRQRDGRGAGGAEDIYTGW